MQVIGRYALFDELARGGMASVHLGRLLGAGGFTRTVAIKRLHPHLARDPEFVAMLLDEARLAGRIRHPNVVAMLDVVATERELFLVMEYVHGETLVRLQKVSAAGRLAPPLCAAIFVNALAGLHAAHEVRGDRGEPLGLVHRDVTPHNLMVRSDGTALVVDFGVAKAAGRFHTTEEGKIKGKLPYMAPEQLRGGDVSRRTDIYAAGAVLWEALVGRRLFDGTSEAEVLEQLLFTTVEPPGRYVAGVPAALDDVVMRALERDPRRRFATAAEMARAIEAAVTPALTSQVAAWLNGLVGEALARQEEQLAQLETAVLDRLALPNDFPASIASGVVRRGADARGPEADARGPEAGGRGPEAGGRGPEAGGRGPEASGRGLEAGGRGLEAGGRGLEAGGRGLEAGARAPAGQSGPSSRPPRPGASSTPPGETPLAAPPHAWGAGEVAVEGAPAAGPGRALDATPAPAGPTSQTAVVPTSQAATAPMPRRIWPWLVAAGLALGVPAVWLGLRPGAALPAPEPSVAADPSGQSAGAAPASAGAPAAARVVPASSSAAPASEPPAPLASPTIAPPAAEGSSTPAAPVAASAASAASAAAVAGSSRAAPPRSSAGVTSRRGAASKRPAVDCSVPYTVDAQGRKIYKRECL
ncbi:protein kinase domain-containing protein [Sorangium sp. So ce1182]|uniref:serine/threonine-protein kinase n=1 Tax=Sorangium sp. So ce1182 TaxID=3133334 RepID=UPI003F5EC0F0